MYESHYATPASVNALPRSGLTRHQRQPARGPIARLGASRAISVMATPVDFAP